MAISFTNKPWLTLLVLFCFLSLVRFSTADTPDWLKQFFFEDHENQDSVLSSTADQNNLNKDYCQCKVISSSRIVGGHTITNFIPWMLSVQLYGRHNCGGFIVNEKQFITAAHCVFKRVPYFLKAVAGVIDLDDPKASSKTHMYKVKNFVVHPNYFHASRKVDEYGDIAVVTIEGKFDFQNTHIKPACIDQSPNRKYNMVIASGYGYTKPNRVVNGQTEANQISRKLKIAEFDQQNPLYASWTMDPECRDNHLICLKPEKVGDSACSGDSGGPLQTRFAQKGKASEDDDSSDIDPDLKGGVAVVGLAGFVSGHKMNMVSNVIEFCFGPSFYHRIAFYKEFLDKYINLDRNACMVDAQPIPVY